MDKTMNCIKNPVSFTFAKYYLPVLQNSPNHPWLQLHRVSVSDKDSQTPFLQFTAEQGSTITCMYHLKSLLLSILHLNPKCKTQLAQERLHLAYNDIFIAKKKNNNLVGTDLWKSPSLKRNAAIFNRPCSKCMDTEHRKWSNYIWSGRKRIYIVNERNK